MLNSTSRTVKLVLAGGDDDRPVAVNFPVSGDVGVDLGAIGRSLGLDPATVRLNGHFLSRGPHLVSSVTWASLLSFFSSRGFPAGGSDGDAIVVEGKTAADLASEASDLAPKIGFTSYNCISSLGKRLRGDSGEEALTPVSCKRIK